MSERNTVSAGGVTFMMLLGLLFIGLRLAHVIEWSWWLVLLPLYGPPLVGIGVALLILVFAGLAFLAAVALAWLLNPRG